VTAVVGLVVIGPDDRLALSLKPVLQVDHEFRDQFTRL
jgi:hypothetical protein